MINTVSKIIDINTRKINDTNFLHWKNWENIIAHEIGHLIINPPIIEAKTTTGILGSALLSYQYELYNIAQDMSIHNHVIPKKYINFDFSQINPLKRYYEANRKMKDENTRWDLHLGLVQRFPFWYDYGHYASKNEGKRILREIERVVQRELKIGQIARDTERLVKPFALGKDCRQIDLQGLTNQGLEYFRMWVSSLGKWYSPHAIPRINTSIFTYPYCARKYSTLLVRYASWLKGVAFCIRV
jgi:hypothetical protein